MCLISVGTEWGSGPVLVGAGSLEEDLGHFAPPRKIHLCRITLRYIEYLSMKTCFSLGVMNTSASFVRRSSR